MRRLVAELAFLLLLLLSTHAGAQTAPDPRAAQPERPSVATHAFTVAPGYGEIELGGEWDHNPDDTVAWAAPALLKIGVSRRVQLDVQTMVVHPAGETIGMIGTAVAAKWHMASGVPILADVAVQAGVKFPTGGQPPGYGTTDGSVILISSHQHGAFSLDVNVGYTYRSGDGSLAPKHATMATVSASWSLPKNVGVGVEVFSYPGTSGRAGGPPTDGLLIGPTYRVSTTCVLDAGFILRLHGNQPDSAYAGVTYNAGRIVR
jgi:hypothetical protein